MITTFPGINYKEMATLCQGLSDLLSDRRTDGDGVDGLFRQRHLQGSPPAQDVMEVDIPLDAVLIVGDYECGDLHPLHRFDGQGYGDVIANVLGGAGHEGIDSLVSEIEAGADETADIAVGQDPEKLVRDVGDENEPLVRFIHHPDGVEDGRTDIDARDLAAADHYVSNFGPESGAEASAGMEFEKILLLEIPAMDQRNGQRVTHCQGGCGT